MAQGAKGKKNETSVAAMAELGVPAGDDFFEMDLNLKPNIDTQVQDAQKKQ